ncbi:Carboxypeptidase Q [Pseudolycoriella hygida]|uniref:Carboxypeptidase Q n=1 Tax=Pseudolycoriella hygida TaxID=35572 RepID=A0A9Q0MLP0_9DIPT|nr:Carboxypeptidase Q [Pseudolycoriella hygida]
MKASLVQEIKGYEPVVKQIINTVINGDFKGKLFNDTATFVDTIGSRVVGSQALDKGIDYMLNWMREQGFDAVNGEEITTPNWTRVNESLEMIEPRYQKLSILGYGRSVSTPGPIEAEIIVVRDYDELELRASEVSGKIVVYDHTFVTYSYSTLYRNSGAAEAAKRGAIAALVAAVSNTGMNLPHTGGMSYSSNQTIPRIPMASISVDSARMLGRMHRRGNKIVLRLNMENVHPGNVTSHKGIDYMLDWMREQGFDAVNGEEITTSNWTRVYESLEMIEPRYQKLTILGYGGSVSTPGPIEAEIIVVKDYDELEQRSSEASGRIVVYDPKFVSYSHNYQYRSSGAVEAAKLGAVAALVAALSNTGMNLPHTGGMSYSGDESISRIPLASISVDTAEMLGRMHRRGNRVVLRLNMENLHPGNITSRNTVGQLTGSALPDQKIIVSGHIDSWDVGQGAQDDGESKCSLRPSLVKEIKGYEPVVKRIINTVVNEDFKGKLFNDTATFVDTIGSRVVGSKALDNGIDYILNWMRKQGFDAVNSEEITTPNWTRVNESLEMIKPRYQKLSILGYGGSVSTPGRIEAEIIVVRNYEELERRSSEVSGKIVVYDHTFVTYFNSTKYRYSGAVEAAKRGAIAALVAAVSNTGMNLPHAGQMAYSEDKGIQRIPLASISVDSAQMLGRMYRRGNKIVLRLNMENLHPGNITSRNTVGQLTGSALPDQKVIVSGHIDSWDVGQGAQDDGGALVMSVLVITLLKSLSLTPRRTIQAIGWTSEENGFLGVLGYIQRHLEEINTGKIAAAFESDFGLFVPLGYEFAGTDYGACIVQEVLKLGAQG